MVITGVDDARWQICWWHHHSSVTVAGDVTGVPRCFVLVASAMCGSVRWGGVVPSILEISM